MLRSEVQRIQYYLLHDPITIDEVNECVNLAMQAISEISCNYLDRISEMTNQAKGEINMMKQLTNHAMEVGDMILLRQRTQLCENMVQPFIDVSLLGTNSITVH